MNVQLYSKPNCPACAKAKQLLKANKVIYEEIELNFGQTPVQGNVLMEVADFKAANPGVASMPQVFINGNRIGGFTELKSLFEAKVQTL